MKKFLLSAATAAAALTTLSADQFYVIMKDGSVESYPTEKVDSISFNDPQIAKIMGFGDMMQEIVKLKAEIESLKSKVMDLSDRVSISSVYKMENGYVIAFTDGEFVELHDGKDGKDGQDGQDGTPGSSKTPTISTKIASDGLHYWTLDGEWLLDENGKMVLAEGTKGEKGDDGKSVDGITPMLKIDNGFWNLSYDQGKTWEVVGKATGEDGKDGICPELKIENRIWYISYDKGLTWEAVGTAVGQDGKTPYLKIEEGFLKVSYDGGTTWTIVEGFNSQLGLGTSGGDIVDGHVAVDLGLPSGKMWASCNVGANSSEDYGQYYAWGDTATKLDYSANTCFTFGKTVEMLALQGYINNTTGILNAKYDAVQHNWGGDWKMPTVEDFSELINYCKWTWTKVGNSNGYIVESKAEGNTNTIFLPAAGMKDGTETKNLGTIGFYWSSEAPSNNLNYMSWGLNFSQDDDISVVALGRRGGFPIRPIYSK